MKTILLFLFLLVACERFADGTIIGHDKNSKPSNWTCAAETFTIVRWDDGTVGAQCGWRGAVGERIRVRL